MNSAPASITCSNCSVLTTVPAPTIAPGTCFISRIASSAAAVRIVTSSTLSPPATSASASGRAVAASSITSTGMTALVRMMSSIVAHRVCSCAKAAAAPNRPGWGWVMSLTGIAAISCWKRPFGDEALGRSPSRSRLILEPQAEPAGDHHACRRHAPARDRPRPRRARGRSGRARRARGCPCPRAPAFQIVLSSSLLHRAALDLGQRLVDRDDRRGRRTIALGRDAGVGLAQPLEQRVLDAVERREIDMAALGLR